MIPIQPVGWWHYLTIKPKYQPLVSHNHFFYLSWEDALWDLVKYFNYQPDSLVLVPDFYCTDVVSNMEKHGLKIATYPVDRNFQTESKIFKEYLVKYQPEIVIIFHAVGITNQLFNKSADWQESLLNETLLIEDSVHRIVDSEKINFVSDRHVVIDSLRKVVPIQGSNLYGTGKLKGLTQTKTGLTFFYQFKVIFWWLIFQLCLFFTVLLPFNFGKKWWNKLAEKSMLIGYDIIGDSELAGSNFKIFSNLSKYIDKEKIKKIKIEQVKIYQKLLSPIWSSKSIFKIEINEKDYGELRALPIGLELLAANKILSKLRKEGLLLRFELDNFGWTKNQKVIYLPLGPHLSDMDINRIAILVKNVILDLI